MCGITGYVGEDNHCDREMLVRMNDSITHRGPDEDGYFIEPGIGLAMRRLSIVDLNNGTQPIFNEDQSVCVVFNGEIYNYDELRNSLEAAGHRFSTNSDTEVIVHLYEEYGLDFPNHLRGMFGIAIWDRIKKRAVLARDRVGIKPLYYTVKDGVIYFGSELKCLLSTGLFEKKVNLQAVDAFMTLNYIPAPITIYEKIHKLEPGHILVSENGRHELKKYWDLQFSEKLNYSENEWKELLEEEVQRSIAIHLMSDVPLGAFLSGGIDSSLVVAMMSGQLEEKLQTFTMGFGGQSNAVIDERPYAKMISDRYGTIYNDFTVSPDFESIAEKIIHSFDEPFSDDSVIPSYYICMLAREKVKVVLSGLGGDELFGGYHRYFGFKLSMYYQYLPGLLHNHVVKPLVRSLREPKQGSDKINHIKRFTEYAELTPENRYLAYVSAISPAEKHNLYNPDVMSGLDFNRTGAFITDHFLNADASDPIDRMYYTDIKTYLPDDILTLSDRLSMKHSLELRVPLVDHKLLELTAKMPHHLKIKLADKKYMLKKIASKYLPEKVISHRKQGFESPMASWLKNDLRQFANDVLSEKNVNEAGFFSHDYIQAKMHEHNSNKQKNNKVLFSLMMFHMWARANSITA